jgi:glycosyltransferase involved in cell wall biosynthesis
VVFLSACLVVRDETARIGATLAALRGFVDEIVVHDTGSTDDTVASARAAGAVVVEGSWDDSFAQARNVALERATGTWVLSVDADETAVGDPDGFRGWLERVTEPLLALTLHNSVTGPGEGYQFTPVRLFRRTGARWSGRVHERVVVDAVPEEVIRDLVPPNLLTLRHSGYSDPESLRRKGIRNGRLAAMELDELVAAGAPPADIARSALKVGRSAVGAGESQRAVDAFEAVRELVPGGTVWNEATDYLARVLLGAGEAELGMVLADQLLAGGVDRAYCSWLRAQALAQLGRPQEALTELDGVVEIVDTAARRHDPTALAELRSLCRQLIVAR